jgi:hypothetical protein
MKGSVSQVLIEQSLLRDIPVGSNHIRFTLFFNDDTCCLNPDITALPLASNALAIRVLFPSVGVIQISFNLTGLPASLGKQKKRALLHAI